MILPIALIVSGLFLFAMIAGPKIGARIRKAHKTPPLHEIFTGPKAKPIGEALGKPQKRPGRYSNENLRKGLVKANGVIKGLENNLAHCQAENQRLREQINWIRNQVGGIAHVDRISCTMRHCVYYNQQLDRIETELQNIASAA